MTENDRQEGKEIGRLQARSESLEKRVARLEALLLGIIGSAAASWARFKGLW